MEKIKIRANSTVSNIGCGFDILGFATEIVSDEIILSKNNLEVIRITKVDGLGHIPTDPKKNAAGTALSAMLKKLGSNQGFDIEITKKVMPGSGLGSSAASSAGVVTGANFMLGEPFKAKDLIEFAMEGEKSISGALHADNVAPAILGGITLIRGYDPLDIISIPVPNELYCVILHPQIEIKTADARNILSKQVDLKVAAMQWGNVAGIVAGFYTSDYELISRSIVDHIIEPQRAQLIQGYYGLKQSALDAGALGCNISGSGPSVFALARGINSAEKVKIAMEMQYSKEKIGFNSYLSKIISKGIIIN